MTKIKNWQDNNLVPGKIYSIDNSPMRFQYIDGYWAMFQEVDTLMPRKYVLIEVKDVKEYVFPEVNNQQP